MKTAVLNKKDVQEDIAAALSMCLSIDLDVVNGHGGCPFRVSGVSKKAVDGLVRLLERFGEKGAADGLDKESPV